MLSSYEADSCRDAFRGDAAADRRQLPEFDRSTGISPAVFSLLRAFTAALALELSPVRVNLIETGFVDTALAASFFNGDEAALEAARVKRPRRPAHQSVVANVVPGRATTLEYGSRLSLRGCRSR
jgi:hypothetical protein